MKLLKNIQSIAKDTLLLEARAIEQLVMYIDDQFEECVRTIHSCSGRVIVTGIGKSANIATKIVATLNSTGTQASFMHAADAIHGDLGMIGKEDIIICLSKSGNTPEIKILVPLLKNIGSKLIALVGNVESYLATNADFVLNASVEKEADPNSLAPTSSTTASLALADALSVCLLQLKEFSSKDFAKYHPGGALGKQLYLKVEDVCDDIDPPKVVEDDRLEDVIVEISSKRLGATAVVVGDHVVGIITDGDLRRMISKGSLSQQSYARDIMSSTPKTIDYKEYAVKAFSEMKENSITHLIVTKEGKYLGIVHLHDLLKEGIV